MGASVNTTELLEQRSQRDDLIWWWIGAALAAFHSHLS